MKEGSQFHFIDSLCFLPMPLASFAVFNEVEEDAVKGEKPTKEGWRHPGDYVLQIEVRVSLYEPLEMLGRLECRLE